MPRVALIVAGIYFVTAAGIAVREAMSPPSGGWISLRYIGAFLATFPVTALLAASAALIYRVVDLVVWFFTSK